MAVPTLNLALQGGGAHGAFTWGVLDALLASGRCHPGAVSGTSAGAMNALALAHGWMEGGPEGAREALTRLWHAVAAGVPDGTLVLAGSDALAPRLTPLAQWMLHWTHYLAPEHANPLDIHPLRDLLHQQFDFERLRRQCPLPLYIAATQANTGRLRLFREHELTPDMVLASACLPTLFRPTMIEGEPYWDGGYSANPPVLPLLLDEHARDTLLVLLMPRRYPSTPRSAADIHARTLDLAFNAPLLTELRQLGHWQAQARRGWWPALRRSERLLRAGRFHLLDGGEALAHQAPHSRLAVQRQYFEALRDLGRAETLRWLDGPGQHVGHTETADLNALFGGA